MSLPYSEGFMMVISEPQGSSLDMGRCSTVGCWQPLCISFDKNADKSVLVFAF